MHHKGTLTIGKVTGKPYHIQCSCGSAGDFPKEVKARSWFSAHTARLGVTETWELVVPGAQQKPKAPPVPPKPVEKAGLGKGEK